MDAQLILIGHYPPPVTLEVGQTLLEAMMALDQRGVRHGVVVDPEGRLAGMLSIRRLLSAIVAGYRDGGVYRFLSSTRVEELMWKNPPHVVVGKFDIEDVIYIMSKLNIGAVVVVSEDKHVLGIISEKHIAGIMALGKLHVAVHEIMTKPVRSVRPETPLLEVVELMDKHRYRHAPVTDEEGRLLAMVTARDVLGYLATERVLDKLREGRDEEILEATQASAVAVGNPATATPGMDVGDALRVMRKRGISALPVVEDEKVVGLISERDIVTRLPRLIGIEMFYDQVRSKLYVARILS